MRVLERDGNWAVKSPPRSSLDEEFSDYHGREYIQRDGRWNFDGDFENPTFTPSVKETWEDPDGRLHVNHFNVTNGQIIYHGDSTNSRSGKTFDLEEIEELGSS